jgi:hypothetical protein
MADNGQEMVDFEFPDDKKEEAKPVETAVQAKSDLEIEVEDDTPESDRNRNPLPKEVLKKLETDNTEELESIEEETKKTLKALKKAWHDERREKEATMREQQEALRLAQKLIEENKKLKQHLSSGEEVYVDAVKQAVGRELEIAKAEYKAAYESGDADRVAEAQDKLTLARIKADKAENYQAVYKNARQNEETDVQIQPSQVARPDSKAIAWQERNTWFGQDEEMTSLALGLHEKLVRSGISVGSDEYYRRIDDRMRKLFPETFEDGSDADVEVEAEPQKAKPKTSPQVVAPASRSTSPKKIRLTKTQVQLANKLGLTPEQYARELTKLEARNG